jgi:hypothetical protein
VNPGAANVYRIHKRAPCTMPPPQVAAVVGENSYLRSSHSIKWELFTFSVWVEFMVTPVRKMATERNSIGGTPADLKRAGVETNGSLECKPLPKTAHRTDSRKRCHASLASSGSTVLCSTASMCFRSVRLRRKYLQFIQEGCDRVHGQRPAAGVARVPSVHSAACDRVHPQRPASMCFRSVRLRSGLWHNLQLGLGLGCAKW